jgi:signal transduction histidine kinase
VIAALELDRRAVNAARVLGYLLVSVPIAVLALPALLGVALRVAGPGRRLVQLERRAANRFLGLQIPRVAGRRTALVLAVKPVLTAAGLVLAAAPALCFGALVELGARGVTGTSDLDYLGPWSYGPLLGLALCALALPVAVLVLATLDGLYGALRAAATALLAPRAPGDGPVRELLAESLGDHSVSIVYWLPERAGFFDEVGRPVELPAPGSGRAWTAIERDGQRVAAIIHDAALDTSRELVQAAAATSSLAIANERLKADLRARVEELRVSRARIVEAADAARRRIERDLHDGAQQRLVAASLRLHVLARRIEDPASRELADDIIEELTAAQAELRELARGIHPAILTERGLPAAIDALGGRSPVPLVSRVGIDGRLPAPVESAIYFVVAEALTNVARYASASSARVDVRREGEDVVVLVADDGCGGADLAAGSGLRGLADRLAALDGTLALDSPLGGGTRLEARIPGPGGDEDAAPEPAPPGNGRTAGPGGPPESDRTTGPGGPPESDRTTGPEGPPESDRTTGPEGPPDNDRSTGPELVG